MKLKIITDRELDKDLIQFLKSRFYVINRCSFNLSLTYIIPYKIGDLFYVRCVEECDEVIIVVTNEPIGYARIRAIRESSNEWIFLMDADGQYPFELVSKVKEFIVHEKPRIGFLINRKGGFQNPKYTLEAGVVIKKDLALKVSELFLKNNWKDKRADIGIHIKHIDLPIFTNGYYMHDFAKGERSIIDTSLLTIMLISTLTLLFIP